jgi:dihydroxyacetone kinase
MNRIIDDPDQVVEDMLRGYLRVHADLVTATANPRVVRHVRAPNPGKVGLVTGGGSGHEPAFLGYVGDDLLDAVAIGEIFSSPTARSFADAFRAAQGGRGVACLYGNYAGDNMNVKLAVKMVEKEGIPVRTVIANDDVPSAPRTEREKRRGVAGEIVMWKVAGAKAAMGASLEEVVAAAQKALDSTRSMGFGLSACTIPAVGKPNFHIQDGQTEVGIGHHGEPGMRVMKTPSASAMADLAMETILPDLPFERGMQVSLLLSGLGATPMMELYILQSRIADILAARGLELRLNFLGNLFTSLDMNGVTVTLTRLDEELIRCLSHPCRSVGLTVVG